MTKTIQTWTCLGVLLTFIALPGTARAGSLPTYTITGGSGTYTIEGLVFSFTGSNVAIDGDVEFSPGPCDGFLCGPAGGQISPNTPIVGSIEGSGFANGINYPTLEFEGEVDVTGAPLTIPDTQNPILSEPVVFTNNPMLTACVPPFNCYVGGGQDAVFNVKFVSSGQVTLYLTGPIQGLYFLNDAVYSPTTPEPSAWLLVTIGLAAMVGMKRRRLVNSLLNLKRVL